MEAAVIRTAALVVGKVLSPLSDGVLEAWTASNKLGSNMEALKTELLHAQGILINAQAREIDNPAVVELLKKLGHLAYGADDALDEIDYFRIQDELDGTYNAADAHAAGCVQDLALNARHTVRACVNKLKFPICSRAATRDGPDEQDDGGKKGCLSGLRFCGSRHEIESSSQSPANQLGVQEVQGRCMPKAVHNVGKHFSCFSLLPYVKHDAPTRVVENPDTTGENEPLQAPKLNFDRVAMSKRILDITEQLKLECANVFPILNLEHLKTIHIPNQDIAINRTETTPQIIQPKLYGRDSHKKIIEDEIINSEFRGLTVLPIVGPGGIGKTTLTQHIYKQMKNHFQVSIWICVSFGFNANKLAHNIVKRIPEVVNENKNCSDEELIEQRIKGKRVLLVLDDVWKHNNDEWKKLMALFEEEAKGNMVIVTTRLPEVANTVKTTKCSLELERLCPQDIMFFFEECVFGDQKPWVDNPGLVEVGSKIVDKLKGSPLAAKTVGRLLRNKLTLNHWISILESKEWESQTNDNDIMPALKLSYDYLPFHLQKCFSFCALFPEDYEFGSEELVHLWIGLDSLQSFDHRNKRIEDFVLCCLDDLVDHGFFKMNKKEDERPYYVVHDLLHDLAVKVSSYECLSIYSSNARDVHITPYVRHLSIIVDDTDVMDKISFEDYDGNLNALGDRLKVENIHTLMLFGNYHGSFAKTFGDLFKEATTLRVIFLSGVSYNLEDILHNFSKLVHLRYLRIKSAGYPYLCIPENWCLPSALFRLYHLKVIDLQNVRQCVSSTRNISKLVKLHHFLVPKDMLQFQSDIFGVGKLKFLHEIREFRVGKESEGFELSQLGQLIEIGGSLGIYNLEKVQTKEEAHTLKLLHKKHLRELILEWDVKRSNKNHVQEENILESLVPHSDLQGLRIKGHGGTNCPSWLSDNLSVKCLESLCLDGVSWKNLPPLGELWMVNDLGKEYKGCSISSLSFYSLKRLQLINISLLKKWVGKGACPFFSHLEVLIIRDCSELVELPFSSLEKMAWFPRLRELVIVDCPKLDLVPSIPWRTCSPCSAQIVRAGSCFARLAYPSNISNESLEVVGNGGKGDVVWSGLNFSNLTDLKELYLKNIPPLPLDELQLLTSLKIIQIFGSCSVLPPVQSAGHGIYRFPVEDLDIYECATSGKELTLLCSFLPNLSTLSIKHCYNITWLGVAEHAETVYEEQQQQTRGDEEIMTARAAGGLLFLPLQLEKLRIFHCLKLSLLSNSTPQDDHSGGGGLQRLCSLRVLSVSGCPEFLSSYSSSSSSFFPFPSSLQELVLDGVKHMETLSNLTSLTQLSLYTLEGLQPLLSTAEGLWPLLAHGRLTTLTIHTPDFFAPSDPSRPHEKEVFSRSSKLVNLETSQQTGFLAAPICSLFSSTLIKLILSFDNKVEYFREEQEEALQLLTSLQELRFLGGQKLQRLPAGLHKLTNLKKLEICGYSAIRSLPSLPSSLEKLKIVTCGSIKSLSKDSLPSSMLELDVCDKYNSKELKRECSKLIGTIPIIKA